MAQNLSANTSVLLPIFSNLYGVMDRFRRVPDQNSEFPVVCEVSLPKLLSSRNTNPWATMNKNPMFHRPWMQTNFGGASTVTADKNQFHVDLDVRQFSPEEISVKVVDRFVVVEGNHEEKRDDHGWISRQFIRRYIIPEQCDIDQVTSKLSSDAILSIFAPRVQKCAPKNERAIDIVHTGQPAAYHAQKVEKVEK